MVLEIHDTKTHIKRYIEIVDVPNDAVWLEETETLGAEVHFRFMELPEGESAKQQTWKEFLELYYFEFLFDRAFSRPRAKGYSQWIEQYERKLFGL